MLFFQVGSTGIEAAWAGGKRGREVTDRFLPVVAQLLSSKGLFYLITIAENDPGELTTISKMIFSAGNIQSLDNSHFPFLIRGDHPFTGQMWFEGRVVLVYKSWK